jgi:hypothetical protein
MSTSELSSSAATIANVLTWIVIVPASRFLWVELDILWEKKARLSFRASFVSITLASAI